MASNSAHPTNPRLNGDRPTLGPFPVEDAPLIGLESDDWFATDPNPVIVVDGSGRLVIANPAASCLLEAAMAVGVRRRQVVFADPVAQSAFTNALAEALLKGSSRAILRGNDGQWRPLELRAWRRFAGHLVFVSFCGEPVPNVDMAGLVRAFELTASEAEVLRLLTEGSSPKDIARRLNVSTNTVRAHLRALYMKMHVRGMPGVIRQVLRLVR